MRAFKIISLNSAAALAVIFIGQNAAVMQLNFIAWAFSMLASSALGRLFSFCNICRRVRNIQQADIQRDQSRTFLARRV